MIDAMKLLLSGFGLFMTIIVSAQSAYDRPSVQRAFQTAGLLNPEPSPAEIELMQLNENAVDFIAIEFFIDYGIDREGYLILPDGGDAGQFTHWEVINIEREFFEDVLNRGKLPYPDVEKNSLGNELGIVPLLFVRYINATNGIMSKHYFVAPELVGNYTDKLDSPDKVDRKCYINSYEFLNILEYIRIACGRNLFKIFSGSNLAHCLITSDEFRLISIGMALFDDVDVAIRVLISDSEKE